MGGLEHDTGFLCDPLRNMDRTRLRRCIGVPDAKYLRPVVTQTTFSLRLPGESP